MNIRLHDEIYTADDVRLGEARRLYHRDPAETNPDLLLYGSYLEVENLDYGDDYYIPVDFIAGHDGEGKLVLRVKMREVLTRTWSREPDFVAHARARVEDLVA